MLLYYPIDTSLINGGQRIRQAGINTITLMHTEWPDLIHPIIIIMVHHQIFITFLCLYDYCFTLTKILNCVVMNRKTPLNTSPWFGFYKVFDSWSGSIWICANLTFSVDINLTHEFLRINAFTDCNRGSYNRLNAIHLLTGVSDNMPYWTKTWSSGISYLNKDMIIINLTHFVMFDHTSSGAARRVKLIWSFWNESATTYFIALNDDNKYPINRWFECAENQYHLIILFQRGELHTITNEINVDWWCYDHFIIVSR